MKTIRAVTDITASPEAVWNTLTELSAYPEWNPFITEISGNLQAGEQLAVRIEPPGARPMRFSPTVLVSEPNMELRWLGRFLLPHIVDGEHSFVLEPLADGRTRLTQQEHFRGLLVPLIGSTIRKTQTGFDAMNQALKRRLEAPPGR
jgi:hypothetical protein